MASTATADAVEAEERPSAVIEREWAATTSRRVALEERVAAIAGELEAITPDLAAARRAAILEQAGATEQIAGLLARQHALEAERDEATERVAVAQSIEQEVMARHREVRDVERLHDNQARAQAIVDEVGRIDAGIDMKVRGIREILARRSALAAELESVAAAIPRALQDRRIDEIAWAKAVTRIPVFSEDGPLPRVRIHI